MADVPYHMLYTDRELVAGALHRGSEVPESEQKVQRTIRELNAWNEAKFAERPAGQTGPESLAQWRAVRDDVRREINALQDEELGTKLVWFPLVGCGWVPAMISVGFGLAHAWSEFIQLRFHMGRSAPEPDPMATHAALGFLQGFLPAFMDRDAAAGLKFDVLLECPGPGGGFWTLRVENGGASLTEERIEQPDLTITQSPETFELIRQGKLDPAEAMQSGAFKAEPMEAMATFGALFAPPSLDKQMEPMGVGALG